MMKSIKNQLFVVFVFFLQPLFAQYFEFKWTDKLEYANNKEGFFSGFINTNNEYVYTLNTNYAVSPLNKNKKLTLVAYNKSTMSEAASVALKGYPENKGAESTYEALDYYKTVVLQERVLVFWIKTVYVDSSQTEEVYVESFKSDLERDQQLKKVYTTPSTDAQPSEFAHISIVLASSKEAGQVVVGSEFREKGKELAFRYVVLNNQLRASAENQVMLPAGTITEENAVATGYECGKDGNIYIRKFIALTREEQENAQPNKAKSYPVLLVINPVSKNSTTLGMRADNKTITDFSYLVTGNKTKVYGFFGDLLKDPSGIDKQGMFYAEIDSDTVADTRLYFTYFEKTSLKKLFPKSKTVRKKKKGVVVPLTEEELNTRFDIEYLFPMENGDVVLFFTRKYNYSEITSKSGADGRNVYKTDFYCEKSNIAAIRISANGKILWTSNIDRNITYNGTDIADLKVIYKLNKFYVIAGEDTPEEVPVKRSKKQAIYLDHIDYTTFDPTSGRAKKNTLEVNEKDVLKKDIKLVDPKTIRVYDDNYYFYKMIVKQKPVWYVANILFFPSIYYSVLSGNTKHASGDLGALYLLDGKPNKKKKDKK